MRRGKIPFFHSWAESRRQEVLNKLQEVAAERAITQLTRLGELDKLVSAREGRENLLVVRHWKRFVFVFIGVEGMFMFVWLYCCMAE